MTSNFFEEVGIRGVVKDLGSFLNDIKRMQGGIDDVGRSANNAEGPVGKLGSTLGTVGKIAAGFLAAQAVTTGFNALTGGVSSAIKAASDLGESVNAVNQIFDEGASIITDWAKTNANSFGLSQREFQQLATPLGAIVKNFGFSAQETSEITIDLTKRAADMASVFNTSVPDALFAITAALRGEQEPIRRYGVNLSEAQIQARALADTGKTVAKELTVQEKAAARLALVFEQTNDTAGDFQKTAGELANSQRIAAARSEEFRAALGQKLLPIVLKVTQAKAALLGLMMKGLLPAFDFLLKVLTNATKSGSTFDRMIKTIGATLQTFGRYLAVVITEGDELNDHLGELPGTLRDIARFVGEVIDNIRDFVLGLTGLNDEAGETADSLGPLFEIGQAVSNVFKAIPDFLRGAADGFKLVVDAGKSVFDLFKDLFDALGLFKGGADGTADSLNLLAKNAELAGTVIGIFLGYLAVQQVINFGLALAQMAYTFATWPIRTMDAIIEGIQNFYRSARQAQFAIEELLEKNKQLLENLKSLAGRTWFIVQDVAQTGAELITDTVKDITQKITQHGEQTGKLLTDFGDKTQNIRQIVTVETKEKTDPKSLGLTWAKSFTSGVTQGLGIAFGLAIAPAIATGLAAAVGVAALALSAAVTLAIPILIVAGIALATALIVAFGDDLIRAIGNIDWGEVGNAILQAIGAGLAAAFIVTVLPLVGLILAIKKGLIPLTEMLIEIGVDIIKTIGEGIISGLSTLGEAYLSVARAVREGILAAPGELLNIGSAIAGLVIEGLVAFFEHEKGGFENIIKGFLTLDPGLVLSGLDDVFLGIPEKLGDALSKIPGIVEKFVSGIPGTVAKFVSGIPGFFAELPGQISDAVSSIPDVVGGFFSDMAGKVLEIIDGLASDLGIDLDGILAAIGKFAGHVVEQITIGFNKALEFVKKTTGVDIPQEINNAIDDVSNAATSLANGAFNVIRDIFTGIVNFVSDTFFGSIPNAINSASGTVISTVTNFAWGIFNTIKDILWNLPGELVDIGKSAINELIRGVQSIDLYGAISNFISNNIPGAVKKVLGIGSPSRVMWDIGRWIVEGLINGIKKMLPGLASAAAAALGVVWDFASGVGGTVTNAAGQALDSAGNVIDDVFDLVGLAAGVRNWKGGAAIVGEAGPELVVLPKGSDVYPNSMLGDMGKMAVDSAGMGYGDAGVLGTLQTISTTLLVIASRMGAGERGGDINFNVESMYATDPRQAEDRAVELGFGFVANARSRGFAL